MWRESRDFKFFPKQGQQVLDSSWWIRFMGSHRVRHDWATELNWTETAIYASWKQNKTKTQNHPPPKKKKPNTLIHIDKICKIEHWLRIRLPWDYQIWKLVPPTLTIHMTLKNVFNFPIFVSSFAKWEKSIVPTS